MRSLSMTSQGAQPAARRLIWREDQGHTEATFCSQFFLQGFSTPEAISWAFFEEIGRTEKTLAGRFYL